MLEFNCVDFPGILLYSQVIVLRFDRAFYKGANYSQEVHLKWLKQFNEGLLVLILLIILYDSRHRGKNLAWKFRALFKQVLIQIDSLIRLLDVITGAVKEKSNME